MARGEPTVIYKLPLAFQQAHGDLLRGHDWARNNLMRLSILLPEIPELDGAVLEAITRDRRTIVRSIDGGSMMKVRKYSDSLGEPESP